MPVVESVPLHLTTSERYLNYALSVITSRALPDIRDGLKPVQRRILYAMYTNLRLLPDARYRKSATVVGEVMGKYHPHGDSAIYDAMVRMAQGFQLRYPLIDGHGNFGSIDGDSPAAMRYTEARLQEIAVNFLKEIRKQTVHFRPNYDGTLSEPVVLPAEFPNLLVNGASGIAVGMATNIPPHNLSEVIDALVALSNDRSLEVKDLVQFVKGPDFPTGGRILNTADELLAIYEAGEGPVELRGEYRAEKLDGGKTGIIIHSIPYSLSKSDLIERIADHIRDEKVPQLLDIRDESTDDIRIVLELRRGADAAVAMAYLFKHTPLQQRFHVNLTCLVPTDNPLVAAPQRVDLKTALEHFLDFRFETITRRLRYDLEQLERRIHILRGFVIIFHSLDEAIKIIRASSDKADAAQRLIHRFRIDEEQADAVLETKLYRLSKLEISTIEQELAEKEAKADKIRTLLDDDAARWDVTRGELQALKDSFGDERRTEIAGPDAKYDYSIEDYIIDENVFVIVSRDGWVKRQRSYNDVESIRVREGDSVGWALFASTRATVCFFSNFGKAYTIRVDQLPSTSGHGDPIQKLFEFSDKERVVGVISLDPRVLPEPCVEPDGEPELFGNGSPIDEGEPLGPFAVAVTEKGMCARFLLSGYSDPSTKIGRLYMKPAKGDSVVGVELGRGDENACLASREGRALIFPIHQIPVFKSAAKGVIAMRLGKSDRLLGFILSTSARHGLEVETNRGRREIIRTTKFEVSNRGNKGRTVISRGSFTRVIRQVVEVNRGVTTNNN